MSVRRKMQNLAKKMWRLVEVHIFFAMSIVAGNAVVKHISASVAKVQDKRQRIAVERAIPDYLSSETATIEKGLASPTPSPQKNWLWTLLQTSRVWLCQEFMFSSLGQPPYLAFNLFQALTPLRI
ncbi:MAG: hypothetical protein NZM05_09610 [Chloroherpetonaceae bacterium]|nr:hypothetical protein [Chloroherpetonaceae bacterium]MCS7211952.1 hypothetical protein [Chloroherpetonaceae bacterium]